MANITDGNKVQLHYRGTLDDGTEFDNSHERGAPIEVEVGAGQVIPGFNNALLGMDIGDKKTVTIPPDEAYGPLLEHAKTEIKRDLFPEDLQLTEGMPVPLATEEGQRILGRIEALSDELVTVDLNHPLAGQTLTFEIEVVGTVEDQVRPQGGMGLKMPHFYFMENNR